MALGARAWGDARRTEVAADGTLAGVAARFSNGDSSMNLEEVFIRATGGTES